MPDAPAPPREPAIGTLRVTTGRPNDPLDGMVTIVADDLAGGPTWPVALMELVPASLGLRYARRLVRCFEACLGVDDAELTPGSVAEMRADRAALINMLIRDDLGFRGSLVVPNLPERPGGYQGGFNTMQPTPSGWEFKRREDAEAAVLWAAREWARESQA